MRDALLALTVRGRAFIAAGVTTTVCSIALGFDALMRVGVLAVALPVLTAFWVSRARYRLMAARVLDPSRVSLGQSARIRLNLVNQGRLPAGLLLFEEHLPPALGRPVRFTVEGVGTSWRRSLEYTVPADHRGHHEIGPLSVRIGDPFGFIALTRSFNATTELVVTPRIYPLTSRSMMVSAAHSGEQKPRSASSGTAEDLTVREHQQGDDLRRVHWPSTARLGELMVRREEQHWQNRATLILDTRAAAHGGVGRDSSLEWAISAAGSIAVHLGQAGYAVRLLTERAETDESAWHDRAVRQADLSTLLLDQLAALDASDLTTLSSATTGFSADPGLVIAVLGSCGASDLDDLNLTLPSRATKLAILVAQRSGVPAGFGADQQKRALAERGWRVEVATPASAVDDVWRLLAVSAASRSAVVVS